MSISDEFVDYVIEQLSGWGEVSARKMFGGAGLYREGVMFGLIADDVAYLKADDSNRKDFVRAGASPFKPVPDKANQTLFLLLLQVAMHFERCGDKSYMDRINIKAAK